MGYLNTGRVPEQGLAVKLILALRARPCVGGVQVAALGAAVRVAVPYKRISVLLEVVAHAGPD